jgi:hypothetical protein
MTENHTHIGRMQGYAMGVDDRDVTYRGLMLAAKALVDHPEDPGHLEDLRHELAELERNLAPETPK